MDLNIELLELRHFRTKLFSHAFHLRWCDLWMLGNTIGALLYTIKIINQQSIGNLYQVVA